MNSEYKEARFLRRFWGRVERGDADDCWLWRGYVGDGGYGQVGYGGKDLYVHRVAFEIAFGEIPHGLHVLHRCDVRSCVNPGHLFAGTHQDNMADCVKKGRRPNIKGEKNPMAKINGNDATFIRSSPLKTSELCEMYKLSQAQVWRIRRQLRWANT